MAFPIINPFPDPKNVHIYKLVKHILENFYHPNKPFMIGIAGAGGAGKTTFATNLTKFIGQGRSLAIDLDDYLLSREERGKLEITGYNPRANKLLLARTNVENLKTRISITKPRYDHLTGKVLSEEQASPRDIIIIEGVTTFYPELQELYDLSFFLDASDETQIKSRINRDVQERGYTLEEAIALFKAVQPDYQRYVEPTKASADIICSVDINYVMLPMHIAEHYR